MSIEIVIREYVHGSAEYEAAVQLRREVLRWPLGLEFGAVELAAEEAEILVGVFAKAGPIVGTLNLVAMGKEFKMRQVAVAPDEQGAGIGSKLVKFSEEIARGRGAEAIVLHAREAAVPFYERLGYSVFGESFEEVSLPHRAMRRYLLP